MLGGPTGIGLSSDFLISQARAKSTLQAQSLTLGTAESIPCSCTRSMRGPALAADASTPAAH